MSTLKNRDLKYQIIMEEMKQQILSGALQPGQKLPSENELSDKYGVSRQTVRKALSILQNAGYIYAQHGKGTFCSEMLRHSVRSRNIGVVLTYLSDYIFPRVIQGIDQVLTEQEYSIILKNTRNSRQHEARCLEDLLSKNIDGLIIEPSKSQIYCRHTGLYQKFEEYGIPYVFIQGCYTHMENRPQVLMDDEKGGFLLTQHLIQTGHKQIVGVFKADDIQGIQRHKGYVRALQENGRQYDPELVIWFHTEDRAIQPYQRICHMADHYDKYPFDAVVSYNDQIAMEVIRALKGRHFRVPEDISVTGYDNSYIAEQSEIRLTTIAHPQEQLGKIAAELLLRMIDEGGSVETGEKILIEPELILRDSSRDRREG